MNIKLNNFASECGLLIPTTDKKYTLSILIEEITKYRDNKGVIQFYDYDALKPFKASCCKIQNKPFKQLEFVEFTTDEELDKWIETNLK
jgi:hypothetical protein